MAIHSDLVKPITLHAARTRRGRKLTQEQLAALSGVSQSVISKLEQNPDANPSIDTVNKLAEALRIDARRLRFGPSAAAMAS